MQVSDRLSGAAIVALGFAAVAGGWQQPAMPGQDIGPAVFPIVVGCGLALCGAAIAFGIGRSFEEEERIISGAAPRSRWYGLRALLPPLLLLGYVFVVESLGFLPTAAIVLLVTSLALGASLRLALPLALIAPFGVHLVFYKLLRVPLPAGVLPAPW
jgi:putative tricarboxylic transport membrane protein